MARRTFADILNSAEISIPLEYNRLIELFYRDPAYSLSKMAERHFNCFPNRGTCISLKDFDDTYGFHFPQRITSNDIDTLVLFCEYSSNLLRHISAPEVAYYARQVGQVIRKIGYIKTCDKKGTIIYTPRSVPAIEVAEIVSESLSYKTLQYNHHSLRGNLEEKLSILKLMADDIELQRKELKSVNSALESNLFQMLQKFVRHNNSDNAYISSMSPQEIETAYDDIYQMWLIAKLELDNKERSLRVKELLRRINN